MSSSVCVVLITAGLDIKKADSADIVGAIYDSLAADAHEVLADQVRKDVRSVHGAPLSALYPSLA